MDVAWNWAVNNLPTVAIVLASAVGIVVLLLVCGGLVARRRRIRDIEEKRRQEAEQDGVATE